MCETKKWTKKVSFWDKMVNFALNAFIWQKCIF